MREHGGRMACAKSAFFWLKKCQWNATILSIMKKGEKKDPNRIRNLFKVGGSWVVDFRVAGKRTRKFFRTKKEALAYLDNYKAARRLDLSYFAALSGDQLKDIKDAIGILPQGKTLVDSVKRAWEHSSDISLSATLDEFKAIKEAKRNAGKLSKKEFSNISSRIDNFKNTFKAFDELASDALLAYLKGKGRNKTVSNWRGTINEFLNYCVDRDIINKNPISKIHKDSFLKDEVAYQPECLTIEAAKAFLAMLEKAYPQYVSFYALALFAGIRIAEIPRMKPEYFRFKEQQIVFPAQIGKVKKSWVLEDLPDNLWEWLKKYPPNNIKQPYNDLRAKWSKDMRLPDNFARHSFATYHLSLYFDFAKTARITRNSEQMLKDHYFEKLVSKKVATEYFGILPSK